MTHACVPSAEEIQALVDGELSPEASARVRASLLSSESALAELDECLQLAALAFELRREWRPVRAAGSQEVEVRRIIPLFPRPGGGRKRTTIALCSVSLASAAAVMVLYSIGRPDRVEVLEDPRAAFATALAPKRPIEARLSWPGADRHRPYDTPRASGRAAESIPFDVLARLEKLGDPRAPIAARVLIDQSAQATAALTSARRSPDVDSDRAAIALVEGKPEDALLAAAAALDAKQGHIQATWNRALALEKLGMPLTAADAFDTVAARREPGWSTEASNRARALRAQFERRKAAWAAATAAGEKLVAGRDPDEGIVAAYPGLMRGYFYDAVRTAGSATRVRALYPLAEALDTHYGGHHLIGYVDRIARSDFRRRGPLAARYAALVRGELTDRAKVHALVADLRAARQDDILLGAIHLGATTPERVDERNLEEYTALARAAGDPWFELLAEEQRGLLGLWSADYSDAEKVLRPAAERCDRGAIDARCLRIYRLLTYCYVTLHRPDAAQRVLDRLGRIVHSTGIFAYEGDLHWYAHSIATVRDDTTGSLLALAGAHLDEWSRYDADCAQLRLAGDSLAMALINRDRLDAARRQMAREATGCDAPFTAYRAFVLAHLLRESGDDSSVQALRGEIAALRSSVDSSPGERAFLDHIEGRLLIDRAPADGRALLRGSIAAASAAPAGDVDADKARSYSYSVLVEDAASRGASAEALDLLAEQRGTSAPRSCALGASLETSAVFVARAADGTTRNLEVPRVSGEPGSTQPHPAAMRTAFAGCEVIDVFARQPYYGRPGLLPPDLAWQYRTGAPVPEASAGSDRHVVVANIEPPAALDLAPLTAVAAAPGAILIEGPAATPERVMEGAADASFLEIHAHGLAHSDDSETPILVLAPDAGGRYALGETDIRRARLRGAPVVALAACHASAIGGAFHSTWGLADAFAEAGARAVIASPDPIQDAGAVTFFASLRARIATGYSPAIALRDERIAHSDSASRAWIDRLVVFR